MPKRSGIVIGLLCLVYIAFRLWRLTDPCLWFDEIFSIHAAELPWADMVPFVAKDLIHPPLFYFLLKLWISAGGESLLWLRLFPVVFAVLTLIPVWMICRELKVETRAAAVTFGLLAVNGALIKYAQEVRMYSLLMFLSAMSIWLFSRFYFRGKSFWMLVIVNVLLIHTHYFGWLVLFSEVAAIAIAQRIKILQTTLMVGAAAASFVPWVIAVFKFAGPESTITQNIGWMARPGILAMRDLALDMTDPVYFPQNSAEPPARLLFALPIAVVFAAAAIIYLIGIKDEERKDRLVFLSIFAALPLLFAFVLSWVLPVSVWGARHLLIIFVPSILLISLALSGVKPAILRNGMIAAIFLLAAAATVVDARAGRPHQIWCAWEDFAAEISQHAATGGAVRDLYVFDDLSAYHYWFALRRSEGVNFTLIKGVDGMPNDPAYFLPRGFDGVVVGDTSAITGDDIWISFTKPAKNDLSRLEVPVTILENMGYVQAEVHREVFGPQTAYLVRMTKGKRLTP